MQKEDAILSTQQQIKKDEYNKLKESVNKLQVEIDTLQTILHHRMLYNKQLVEMCLPSVTAAENISVDDVDLTQVSNTHTRYSLQHLFILVWGTFEK